jgi:hypothetical protein
MFGYEKKKFLRQMNFLFAMPEKALLDLLYLYPFYDNITEIRELRFDDSILHEIISGSRLDDFAERYEKKALLKRVKILKEVYGL